MEKMNPYWLEWNRSYLMTSIEMVMDELSFHFFSEIKNQPFKNSDEKIELLESIGKQIDRKPNLDILVEQFQLSNFERKIILACAGIELSSKYSEVISKIHGRADCFYPAFNILLAGLSSAHWDAISPASPLRKWDLVHFDAGTLLANQPMKLDESILHFLTGCPFLEEKLLAIIKKDETDYLITQTQQSIAKQIVSDCINKQHSQPLIELNGNPTKDKFAVTKHVCNDLGYTLFKINALSLPTTFEDVFTIEKLWNRQARLNSYALYIEFPDGNHDQHSNYNTLNHFANNCKTLTFIDGNVPFGTISNSYFVEKPTKNEQKILWTNLLKEGENHSATICKLVEHFNLSANTIKTASAEINQKSITKNHESILWQTCCKYTRPILDNLVQRINALATWDDIVLPPETIKVLKEITMHVRFRSKVYHDGGFAKKQSRGLGISALFSGESGTGKTMGAEVIANDLMLDLYRVDLSQVVNKYIGETEKNLKKIFDAAEAGGAILLFDEADALFGKRGEVKDSNDRHSNLQIGYLLQRMENYNGLAILTTNMKNAIDKAFERRIRFSINFERPDAQQRKIIWKKAFPNQNWVNGVDYNKLATANIPGGNIKNIAMNAAFLAASEDSKIGMHHLLEATKSEYKKVDRHLSNSEIKDWE